MALTFRSYKSADLIIERDSAVDGGHSAYVNTYFDTSKLVIKSGEQPTVFKCEALDGNMLAACSSVPEWMRDRYALSHALKDVQNLMVKRGDAEPAPAPAIRFEANSEGKMVVAHSWWADAQLDILPDVMAELASYVFRLSSPDPT